MEQNYALGIVETRGMAGLAAAAEAVIMIPEAEAQVHRVGGGYSALLIWGREQIVREAVETCAGAAERMGACTGRFVSKGNGNALLKKLFPGSPALEDRA